MVKLSVEKREKNIHLFLGCSLWLWRLRLLLLLGLWSGFCFHRLLDGEPFLPFLGVLFLGGILSGGHPGDLGGLDRVLWTRV